MSNTKKEYDQSMKDMETMVESTNELIDMHFTEVAKFFEDKNVGVLKAYRTLLQRNLDQADVLGKNLVESTVTTFNKEERIRLGSLFGAVTKIIDLMGYIDYLLEKRKIDKF